MTFEDPKKNQNEEMPEDIQGSKGGEATEDISETSSDQPTSGYQSQDDLSEDME